MKAHVLDFLFNTAVGLQTTNFIKKWLQHRCFPVSNGYFYVYSKGRKRKAWNKGAKKNF